VAGKKILGSKSLQHFLHISRHGDRYCSVLPIECDDHAEIDVTKRSYFKFVLVFFKGTNLEYSKIVDDEAKHYFSSVVPKEMLDWDIACSQFLLGSGSVGSD
jgi:hypothetical protein